MAHMHTRSRMAATLVAALALAASLTGTAIAAKSGPGYTSVLTTDGACAFTLTATWPGSSKTATVIAMFYLDGAFLATMQAPFTGPNAGTIKGRTATFVTGAFATLPEDHSWRVLTQFYSTAGVQLQSMDSNTVTVPCGVAP